jgi:hypothetical protein
LGNLIRFPEGVGKLTTYLAGKSASKRAKQQALEARSTLQANWPKG